MSQTINEIRTQQTGADLQIYAEIAGTPNASLAGLSLIVIGGDDAQLPPDQNGYIESVISLDGYSIPASGFFVMAEATYTLTTPDLVASLGFATDNNKTFMLVRDFFGVIGDDIDLTNLGTIDNALWSAVVDDVALLASGTPDGTLSDFVYSTHKVGPDGGAFVSHAKKCADSGAWRVGFADVASNDDTPGAANPICGADGGIVTINEIRIDQPLTDVDEYVELTGNPGMSLNDYTYIVIGDGTVTATKSGFTECVIPLTGQVMPANGLFLITLKTTTGSPIQDGIAFGKVGDLQTDKLIFENSDHVTHMLVKSFTGTNLQDLDTNDDGILDIKPWASVADSVGFVKVAATGPVKDTVGSLGVAGEWTYQVTNADGFLTPMVGPDGVYVPGHIYRCSPQGSWKIGFFDPIAAGSNNKDTPKAANPECSACGEPGSGSCFVVHAGAGCDKGGCCSIVCAFVPACCSVSWDANCTSTAFANCLAGGSPPVLQISEIRLKDIDGNGASEYLEFTGPANASLTGVSVVVINKQDTGTLDTGGVIDAVIDLSGLRVNSSGRFLIGESTFAISGVTLDYNCGGGLVLDDNGTNNVFLVWNNYGARNDDLDPENDGTLNTMPWASVIDSVSVVGDYGVAYSPTLVGPAGGKLPSQVFRCTPDGDWNIGPTSIIAPYDSPGAANAACGLPRIFQCGDTDAGDCYQPHINAHCFNRACCEGVCAMVPSCCNVIWDELCSAAAASTTSCGGGTPIAFINEVRVDQPGTDVDEYIELKGTPGTNLAGYSIVVVGDGPTPTGGTNPLSGAVETIIPLDGSVIPASGYFLITFKNALTTSAAQDGIALGIAGDLQTDKLNLENSDNITIYLTQGFAGAMNDDMDANNDGVIDGAIGTVADAISITTSIRTAPTSTQEWWYAPRVGSGPSGAAYQIYRCDPIGYWQIGIDDPISATLAHTDTPGAVNNPCPSTGGGCFGDIDQSGEVDLGDAALALLDYGPCSGCASDLDGSGEIDFGDIALILLSTGPCQ